MHPALVCGIRQGDSESPWLFLSYVMPEAEIYLSVRTYSFELLPRHSIFDPSKGRETVDIFLTACHDSPRNRRWNTATSASATLKLILRRALLSGMVSECVVQMAGH